MIVEADEIAIDTTVLRTDIAIVGAGTVGLFLAKCLTDVGREVLLLEAGSVTASCPDVVNSVGKPHSGVKIGRAYGVGGTSVLWGGQLAEFQGIDLIRPGYEWPIPHTDIVRHYAQAFRVLGLPPSQSIEAIQAELAIKHPLDADLEQFFTYWLPQPNFAILFKGLIKSPRVKVIVRATAFDIQITSSGTAETLHLVTPSGRFIRVQAKRFVLASGSVGSAQFFLSSGKVGRKPWSDNAHVGAFFQDHLGGQLATVELINERRFRQFFENATAFGHKLQPKLRFSTTSAQRFDTSVCGFFSFDSSVSAQIGNLKRVARGLRSGASYSAAVSAVADGVRVGRLMLPIILRYVRDRRVFAVFDRGIGFNVQAEQWPIATSAIRLAGGDQGPNHLLPVVLDWRIDGRELRNIRAFMRTADRYLQELGVAKLKVEPALLEDDASLLNALSDTYHQCGGLRMSASAAAGVTDCDGKVWGTTNVFVAGAATMPTSSYANCTLTALALGSRLAERLAAVEHLAA